MTSRRAKYNWGGHHKVEKGSQSVNERTLTEKEWD